MRAGLPGGGKGKTDNQGKSVSYVIPEQAALEEQAMQDRILYEMRQNLAKLKEYGRQLGIAFDVSKKKSRGGRMQGEKWVDDEMELWKKQATRLLKGPEDLKPEPEDEHRAAKMEEMVFKMERLLNDVKYVRICKQRQHDALDNELNVTADMEAREQSGDGKMAAMMAAVAILREKIQDTDQKLGEEEVGKRELTKVHDDLYGEYRQNQNKLDDVRKALDNFGHDSNQLRLQLKDKLHDIEKVLGQGKLLTMAEIKEEMQTKYGRELDSRQKVIQKQIKIKEMLRQHEARARELTKKLQSQYDPNKDSPRRNELKRKALAFEEVFDTMMQRIGESDITKIVDLFQKQSFTCNAWMEAVRDQEVRVKALLDEKALLDTQLQRVSAKKPQGSSNETRQYTITGRRLDMATGRYPRPLAIHAPSFLFPLLPLPFLPTPFLRSFHGSFLLLPPLPSPSPGPLQSAARRLNPKPSAERCETSNERLMQLDGLIAHIKESVRMALIRVKDYISDTEVPPLVFPDDGEGGLLDWVDKFATQVATLVPTEEQYKLLAEYDSRIELPPEFRIDESNPYGLSRPHTARTVDLRTADKAYAAAAPKEEASAEAEGTPETPVVPQTPVATSDAPNAPEEAAAAAPPSPEKNVGFTETAGSGEAGHAPEAKAYTGIYVSMPAKLKVAIRMAPDDVTHDGKEEDETEVPLTRSHGRVPPPEVSSLKMGGRLLHAPCLWLRVTMRTPCWGDSLHSAANRGETASLAACACHSTHLAPVPSASLSACPSPRMTRLT